MKAHNNTVLAWAAAAGAIVLTIGLLLTYLEICEVAETPRGSNKSCAVSGFLRAIGTFVGEKVGLIVTFSTGVVALFAFALWKMVRHQLGHHEVDRANLVAGGSYATSGPKDTVYVDSEGDRHLQVEVVNPGIAPALVIGYDVHFARLADLKPETEARPVALTYSCIDRVPPSGGKASIGTHKIDRGSDVAYGAVWYQGILQDQTYECRFILSLGKNRTRANLKGVHRNYRDAR